LSESHIFSIEEMDGTLFLFKILLSANSVRLQSRLSFRMLMALSVLTVLILSM